MTRARKLALIAGSCLVLIALGAIPALATNGFLTSIKPYAVPVGDEYTTAPLISAGDTVPRTGDASKTYQFVGIPDGTGVSSSHGRREVYVNHELGRSVQSEPRIGEAQNRGAFVSKLRLGGNGAVLSGDRAYDTVFDGDTLVGPAADTLNGTSAFARFCAAFMADWRVGFSEPVYLTGEESGGGDTFTGAGGSSVAIFRNEAHTLPKLGKFAKENQVVVPHTGGKTVIFVLEDGPASPDSQLYMYVGKKVPGASSVLRRNGLDNGKLYALAAPGHSNEGDFTAGSLNADWVELPDAATQTDVQLEAAADAAGAMGFVRIEDGDGNGLAPGQFHFVTTGAAYPAAGTPYNKLGRVYRLNFNPFNPTARAKLTVIANADAIVAGGGDTALSPDNVEVNGRYLMVQEDGTSESRPVMGSKGRDGSIWRFDLWKNYKAERVVELDPPGRDGTAVGPGVWESSGIVDTTLQFGWDSWIFDVQAHGPTAKPTPTSVEDGQLLLMRRK